MSTSHPVSRLRRIVDNPRRAALAPIRFAGFWSAVLLPMVLAPLLFSGVASQHLLQFTGLLALNVVAAIAGRNYRSD